MLIFFQETKIYSEFNNKFTKYSLKIFCLLQTAFVHNFNWFIVFSSKIQTEYCELESTESKLQRKLHETLEPDWRINMKIYAAVSQHVYHIYIIYMKLTYYQTINEPIMNIYYTQPMIDWCQISFKSVELLTVNNLNFFDEINRKQNLESTVEIIAS